MTEKDLVIMGRYYAKVQRYEHLLREIAKDYHNPMYTRTMAKLALEPHEELAEKSERMEGRANRY